MQPDRLIQALKLKPLPMEGGYYRETYRSEELLDPSVLEGDFHTLKNLSTAIIYLLTDETFSALHRLPTDEIIHFYMGAPVTMVLLKPGGQSEVIKLGHDLNAGHHFQYVVPAGTWQGLFIGDGGNFALMGTTMSPGFDFDDLEVGLRDELIEEYPYLSKIINKLTRE